MVCAVCLWQVSLKKLQTVAPATTAVRGTALCTPHAMAKLAGLKTLQDLELR